MVTEYVAPDEFKSVSECAQLGSVFGSKASLRWQIFNAELNGLADSGAICRRGRRIFIHVPKYLAWVAGQNTRAA